MRWGTLLYISGSSVWLQDQQYQHSLGACCKCKVSAQNQKPIESESMGVLQPSVGSQALQRILMQLKVENHWCIQGDVRRGAHRMNECGHGKRGRSGNPSAWEGPLLCDHVTLDKYWGQSWKLSTEKSLSNHCAIFHGGDGEIVAQDGKGTWPPAVTQWQSWELRPAGFAFLLAKCSWVCQLTSSMPQFPHLENGADNNTYRIILNKLRFHCIKYGVFLCFFLDNFIEILIIRTH